MIQWIIQKVLIPVEVALVGNDHASTFYAGTINGDTYANTKVLGLILSLIFTSPNRPLGQSLKPLKTSMSYSGINNLKRIGLLQGTDIQALIASSISLIDIYVPHADVSYLFKFNILSQTLFAYFASKPLNATDNPLLTISRANALTNGLKGCGSLKQLPLKSHKSIGQNPNPQFTTTSGKLNVRIGPSLMKYTALGGPSVQLFISLVLLLKQFDKDQHNEVVAPINPYGQSLLSAKADLYPSPIASVYFQTVSYTNDTDLILSIIELTCQTSTTLIFQSPFTSVIALFNGSQSVQQKPAIET
ncbi:MAG: hypothetical protein EZS28_008341 [Streblomastix strix]|uniref:Uncharacterized protein n=1 Tax=Streblomastix strix TaxID=222440 RepID=A0A5J4WMB7_9EUKA|nr:MAG: hypothetical protein EZS28_008341 [Streblomastix strix]